MLLYRLVGFYYVVVHLTFGRSHACNGRKFVIVFKIGMNGRRYFYVVFKGRQTGIFSSWEECEHQVTGHKGACYKRYTTYEEAERAFVNGMARRSTSSSNSIGDVAPINKMNLLFIFCIGFLAVCVGILIMQ